MLRHVFTLGLTVGAVIISTPCHAQTGRVPKQEFFAAYGDNTARSCDIGVRVICGSERSALRQSGKGPKLHSLLYDVSQQLEPLPFAKYSPLAHDRQRLAFEEQGTFRLLTHKKELHKLTVVPHRIEGEKVHLTVDWQGPGDEKLLSTKLRVVNGQNMVVGTDSDSDSSTILCIKVNCE